MIFLFASATVLVVKSTELDKTQEVATYFDMGACYNDAAAIPMGVNVYQCQLPYFLRLLTLHLVCHTTIRR